MDRKKRLTLLTVLSGLAFSIQSPADDAADRAAKLQGKWKSVQIVRQGDHGSDPAVVMTIAGDQITVDDGKNPETSTLKLRPSKSPSQFEISGKDGVEVEGIYELKGDELKMAWLEKGNDAPASFDDKRPLNLVKLVRIPKAAATSQPAATQP
jgi:uncharacterized protein (TIGR03067 family)